MGIQLGMHIAVQNIGLQSPGFSRVQNKPGILDLIRDTIGQEEQGRYYNKEEDSFRKCPGFQVGSELIHFYGEITGEGWVSHISASAVCRLKVVIRDFSDRNDPCRDVSSAGITR